MVEQCAQFGALAVAEACERLGGGDPAVGECAVGLDGADPGHGKQQLAYFCARRVSWRVGEDLCQLDLSGCKFSLQARALAADLVGLRECTRPLLA